MSIPTVVTKTYPKPQRVYSSRPAENAMLAGAIVFAIMLALVAVSFCSSPLQDRMARLNIFVSNLSVRVDAMILDHPQLGLVWFPRVVLFNWAATMVLFVLVVSYNTYNISTYISNSNIVPTQLPDIAPDSEMYVSFNITSVFSSPISFEVTAFGLYDLLLCSQGTLSYDSTVIHLASSSSLSHESSGNSFMVGPFLSISDQGCIIRWSLKPDLKSRYTPSYYMLAWDTTMPAFTLGWFVQVTTLGSSNDSSGNSDGDDDADSNSNGEDDVSSSCVNSVFLRLLPLACTLSSRASRSHPRQTYHTRWSCTRQRKTRYNMGVISTSKIMSTDQRPTRIHGRIIRD
eukprot:TRINITY_DN14413_c0_g1_i3.p1 TRINITY_DN14413_c0_g1~~TRINITY_DN14413_c0_g1_i3.p1  ORF type:complete len:355 (+),score=40.02 TRINITY_DN14413_c0_g1_i3:36-1067(+)